MRFRPPSAPFFRRITVITGAVRRLAGRSAVRPQELVDTAAEIVVQSEKLARFGRDSDAEFSELARQVGGVHGRLAGIRDGTATLARVVAADQPDHALAAAYTIYKGSVDLVHACIGIAATQQTQLEGVEAALRGVGVGQVEFKRNSLMYRILAMGVRMEASRLEAHEQGTFFNVASAISEIERQMSETTEKAFARIEEVVVEAAAERAQLGTLHALLHQRAQSSIRTIQDELTRVQTALGPCAEQSRAINGGLQAAAGRIAHLTTALQYQDIVRQKLQHVSAGFEDLLAHLRGAEPSGAPRAIDRGYVHHAAQLQGRQLQGARAEITRAAGALTTGMQDLLGGTQELVAQFEEMHATASGAFGSCQVGPLFDAEIAKLSDLIGQSETNHRTIAALVGRIEEVVNVFARDVGAHQFEVLLVSLNAQIAAARVSSADALNKLAEEAIRLAAQNSQVTAALAASLAQTLQRLDQIKREAEEFLVLVTREKCTLESGAATVGAHLQELTDRIQREAGTVHRDFSALHTQVEQLVTGLRFPAEIAAVWDGAETLSAQLAAMTAEAHAAVLDDDSAARLEAHRGRYTMVAEHEAHSASLAKAPHTPLAEPAAAPALVGQDAPQAPKAGEFGDDIELF